MNCQNFENILIDLARGLLMDAGVRESGLAHADSCARCRARLSVERALNGGLRAVAASAGEQSAPARVESVLLAAFRAQHANPTQVHAATTDATHTDAQSINRPPAKVLPATFAREERTAGAHAFNQTHEANVQRFALMKLRAAATVLLIFAAGLLALLASHQTEPERDTLRASSEANRAASWKIDGETAERVVPFANNSGAAVDPSALEPRDDGSTQATLASVKPLNSVRQAAPVSFRPTGSTRTPRIGGARYTDASLNNNSQRGALSQTDAAANQAEAEITTDFFPLAGASALTASDGGHVVRVELPRSALGAFGLPVDAERTGGRVKADVLLGDDGVARAVRFVR